MGSGQKRIGNIIIPPGVIVSKHEKLVADFLAIKRGVDVTFLVPDRQKGRKTPDIEMTGRLWEIKSPKGKSPRTIENTIRDALKQSPHIVLDLRRMDGRVPTMKYVDRIEFEFSTVRPIRSIVVITRQENILDYSR